MLLLSDPAGCSQSLMFLAAVYEFEDTCQSAGTTEAQYKRFVHIVDEFIANDSRFEVNIDSTAKNSILENMRRITFEELNEVWNMSIVHTVAVVAIELHDSRSLHDVLVVGNC